MTPTILQTIIIMIFIIIFISIIVLSIFVFDSDGFEIMFGLFIILCGITLYCVSEHSTYNEYSSQEYDVNAMLKIIPKEHFKEEIKYINSSYESSHKVLIHKTLFKTEEWKLIKYIPKEEDDEYEKFKLSKTKSD